MLSELKIGTKTGLTQSVVLPTNPEWSIVRTKTEWLSTFLHCKATVMVLQSIQPCFLWKRYRWVEKEHAFQTGSSSYYKSILEKWGYNKHMTSLFLLRSESGRSVIATENDWLERAQWWTKHGTVQAKQSLRSWLFFDFFNSRRGQDANLVFHQSSCDAIICARQYAGKRTGQGCHFLQVKYCSKGTSRLQTSWRRLLANGLTCAKQVNQKYHIHKTSLEFSDQIGDDCRIDQELRTGKTERVDYYLVSDEHSEIHVEPNENLERHDVSKIEDRVQCQICLRYQRTGETFCTCGRMAQGLTEEAKKQAEQRISSPFIMYVLCIHDLASKKTKSGRHCGKPTESQQLKRAKDDLDSAQKHNCGTIVDRYFEDEQFQKRMHEQGYTQSEVEEFDREALKRKNYVATHGERRYCRDQHKVVQSNQGGGSDTVKTKCHPGHKQIVRWQIWKIDKPFSRSRCGTVVIVVILDTVTSNNIFLVGLFLIVAWRQAP